MQVIETEIPGVLIIEPKVFGDDRGFFLETWQRMRYAQLGIPEGLVQDNLSYSQHGVLRGLHVQNPSPQGKLVQVIKGAVFDVAVDIRAGSPWFGRWVGVSLSAENKRQFWVPEGFAHGFLVTAEDALFTYKCSDYYNPRSELSIRWDDPDIGIEWPLDDAPALSAKDADAMLLKDVPQERLTPYKS